MFNFIKHVVVLSPLAAFVPQAAMAGNLDFIWRASDAELGPVSWTGFIFSPEVSKNTLNLSGSGSELLKDPKGFRAGLELGYDYQIQNLVVGVAADSFYTWMDGGSSDKGAGRFKSKQPYMGSLRGRLGFNHGRFMMYGTGGLALSKLEIEDQATGNISGNTMTGWVAGAGVEYVWNKNITARLEYLHSHFGTYTYNSLPTAQSRVSASIAPLTFHIVLRF